MPNTSVRLVPTKIRSPAVRMFFPCLIGLVLLALLSPPVMAIPAATCATLSVSPGTVSVGQTLTLSGTGCPNGGFTGSVVFGGGGTPLTFCTGGGAPAVAGSCSVTGGVLKVTFDLWWGVMGVATVQVSGVTTTTTFNVAAVLSPIPATQIVGGTVNVAASGFDPGRGLRTCNWDGAPLTGFGCFANWVAADTKGNASTSFTVPPSPYGLHTLYLQDNGGASASTVIMVTPSLTLAPTDGTIGTPVTVSGGGYSANTPFEIMWNPGPTQMVVAAGTTDGAGSIPGGVTFNVPNVPGLAAPGYTVKALDGNGVSMTTTFIVDAQLAVAPSSGPVGTGFSIFGNGFIAGSTVTFTWDPGAGDAANMGSTVATAAGDVSFATRSPPSWNGGHIIVATAPQNPAGATCPGFIPAGNACAFFNTLASLNLTPLAGPTGTTVSPSLAQGLSAGVNAYLIWDPGLPTQQFVSPTPCGTCVTNASGSLTFPAWNVPASAAPGPHTVEVQDANGIVATATFYVGPFFALIPSIGPVSTSVTVIGVAYGVGNTVSINWVHISTPLATVKITLASGGSFGNFSTTFNVPADPIGSYTVWANTTGITTTASFRIVPSLAQNRTSGPVGSTDVLSGRGLAAGTLATVVWDGVNTASSVLSNSKGNVTIPFAIPRAPAGSHTLQLLDALGDTSNTVSFTVTPSIIPATNATYEGNTVSVVALGFAATTSVELSWNGVPIAASAGTTDATGSVTLTFPVPNVAGSGTLGAADSSPAINSAPGIPFTIWPLAIPSPVYPLTGAYVNASTDPSLSLSWTPLSHGNVTYTVEWANTSGFTSGTTTVSGVSNTRLSVGPLANGWWYWRVEAVDASGGTAGFSAVQSFLVDTVAPTGSVSLLPQYESVLSFPVSWTASDGTGSGVAGAWIWWSNDSGTTWTKVSSSLIVTSPVTFNAPGPGTYEFSLQAVDKAGNIEAFAGTQATTVVDPTPPISVITLSGPSGTNGWYTGPVTVSVSASGGPSGIASIHVNTGTGWMTYTGPVTISTSGFYNISAYAVSSAGVTGSTVTAPLKLDTIVPATASNALSSWYITGTVSITLTPTAGPSGVAATYSSVDGLSWRMGTTVPISGNGVHTLAFYSVSGAGLAGPVQTQTIRIDATMPSVTARVNGTLGLSGWYTTPVSVTLFPTGGPSGIAATYYRNGTGGWTLYAAPFTVGTEGTTMLSAYSVSGAGIRGNISYWNVSVDTIVPTTSSNVQSGWYTTTTVNITLTATAGPSGVAATYFSVDGLSWKTGTTVPISGNGVHTLSFYSVSRAGLAGPVQTQTVRIDAAGPTVSAQFNGTLGRSGWYTSPVTVTLSTNMGPSGISALYYRNGTGPWIRYTVPFSVGAEGTTMLSAYAVSGAGIVGNTEYWNVSLDTIVPLTTSNVQSGWYTTPTVSIALTATAGPSGVAVTYWSVDGGNWMAGTNATVTGQGTHILSFYSVSKAGLAESALQQVVRIDSVAPATHATLIGNLTSSGWYGTPVTLVLSAQDNSSGVAGTWDSTSGPTGPWQSYSGPLTFAQTGTFTVWFYSTDIAGNTEKVQSVSFEIDIASTSITLGIAPGATIAGSPTHSFPISVTDPAGVMAIYVSIDEGPRTLVWSPSGSTPQTDVSVNYNLPTGSLSNGAHLVTVTAVNALGQSTSTSETINVDNSNLSGIVVLVGVALFLVLGLLGMLAIRQNRRKLRPQSTVSQGTRVEVLQGKPTSVPTEPTIESPATPPSPAPTTEETPAASEPSPVASSDPGTVPTPAEPEWKEETDPSGGDP